MKLCYYLPMKGKKQYIATGVLIGVLASFVLQFAVLSFSNGIDFFERSISGLKITFTLLPIAMLLGAAGGYAVHWLHSRFKKRGQEKPS